MFVFVITAEHQNCSKKNCVKLLKAMNMYANSYYILYFILYII